MTTTNAPPRHPGLVDRTRSQQASHASGAELELMVLRAQQELSYESGVARPAVEALLQRVAPIIGRYCRARIGHTARHGVSADNVTQETLIAVVAGLSTYRSPGRSFLAFVHGIAAHKVTDAFRAATREHTVTTDVLPDRADTQPGPEHQALRTELRQYLLRLLGEVPATHRDLLILTICHGMSGRDTAAALGTSEASVRVIKHRALARLRSALLNRNAKQFARLRLGAPLPGGRQARESDRAVHLVPLPPGTGVPQLLVAFSGQPTRPGTAELADQLAGIPCTACLLRDPR